MQSLTRSARLAALALPLAAAAAATADYVDVVFVPIPKAELHTPDGYQAWRAYARFDDENDYVVSVGGWEVAPIQFDTSDPQGLLNIEDFQACVGLWHGTFREDLPSKEICGNAMWDSWVAIGSDSVHGDTAISDEFLDRDGIHNVVKGTHFLEIDGEGWYDANPGTPEVAGAALRVLLGQFTVREGFNVELCGFLTGYDDGDQFQEFFCADSDDYDCPGDIDGDTEIGFGDLVRILAAWGNRGGPEDLDGSGFVDFGDVVVLLAGWGPCP